MTIFKDAQSNQYKDAQPLTLQAAADINQQAEAFCKRYPIVTFSARISVRKHIYDYIIMDEASQVSIETGVLALTCAWNAVIVGDTLQLPNVVTEEDKLNFCNQKYYGGNLLTMTEDHDEENVLHAIKTVPGQHARGHYNQREIDVLQ